MTHHRKTSPLPQIKPGDIISLPELEAHSLALVMMDDYKAGEFKGIYYLPIRAMPRKTYRGQNVEGEQYHLSAKDHDEIRKHSKRSGEYRLSEKSIYRLNYEMTHADFNEEKLPEVFFIKYASTAGTKFFQQAMRQFNILIEKKEGLIQDVQELSFKLPPRMKAPSQREAMMPSDVTEKDISLKDATDPEFVDDSPYISYVTLETLKGIGNKKFRPETLKQAFKIVTLIENDEKAKTAFVKSFDKHARGKDWTMAEMCDDIKAGWKAFTEHVLDPQNYDMSSVKTDYPVRRNG